MACLEIRRLKSMDPEPKMIREYKEESKLGTIAWEKGPKDYWTKDQRLESERHTIRRKDLRKRISGPRISDIG